MASKTRRPRKESDPASSKKPRTASESPQPFRWRTDHADLSKKGWGWGRLSISEFFRDIASKLHHFEDWTWPDMVAQDQVHFTPPAKIVRKAQKRLEELAKEAIIPDDLIGEELASIHVASRPVVWGYRVGKFFHLLWWDPEHTVYPVEKRHT